MTGRDIHCLIARAAQLRQAGRPDEAVPLYGQVLAVDPNNVEALANLGNALYDKGALEEAEAIYAQVLALRPANTVLLNNYAGLLMARGKDGAAMEAVWRSLAEAEENPRARFLFVELSERMNWDSCGGDLSGWMVRALTEAWDRPGRLARASAALIMRGPLQPMIARANAAWPARLSAPALFGDDGVAALANDVLLAALLVCAPNADISLERFLTLARNAMLEAKPDDRYLSFLSRLAQQCFINEYIFAAVPDELHQAWALCAFLAARLDDGAAIAPSSLVLAATYFPLHTLPGAARLLSRSWPAPVKAVLTQQVREPEEELRLGAQIPALTPVTNSVSRKVQQQYEKNPYPRWVRLADAQQNVPFPSIAAFVRAKFPFASIDRDPEGEGCEILVAGCGTGQHPISTARKFGAGNLLAVDLSRASLGYAVRKSREMGFSIAYAKADILELGTLQRRFDLIESLGVLHHMQDPFAAWRILLGLLKPGGFMRLGLYSAVARQTVALARARIAERGLSTADIRTFRHELAAEPDRWEPIITSEDFFSFSSARDLMFHVEEHLLTLPQIAGFLKENSLDFLGFEIPAALRDAYRTCFPSDVAATDLGNWDMLEQENPRLFNRMYMFWVRTSD